MEKSQKMSPDDLADEHNKLLKLEKIIKKQKFLYGKFSGDLE